MVKMKKILVAVFLLLSAFTTTVHAHGEISNGIEQKNQTAIIFYNEACGMCAQYTNEGLPEMLGKVGVTKFIKKDYVNEKKNRIEMNEIIERLGVPLELQSHMMTFVGDKYILGGHIPEQIITEIFKKENSDKFKRIIVYQDLMHGEIENYKIWAIPAYADDYVGEPQTFLIDTPVEKYFEYLDKNKDTLVKNKNSSLKSLLPIVLASGFLDGINPCAFAVLLLFIAFLLSIKRGRAGIWKMGVVYISAIFLAYIFIGFGILKALMFFNSPHFMAKLGAWLIVFLGTVNVFNYFSEKKIPLKLGIPTASKNTIHKWMYKATLPAAFVMGFLVGLCTFPCSGGIYVAIIGLLVAKTTYWTGVGYLLLYNVMFVMPLILILIFAANKYTFVKFGEWQQRHKKTQKLILGITMLALGLIILLFFVN